MASPDDALTTNEEADDGMRVKCEGCDAYVKPDPEGRDVMTCEECHKSFTLCDECRPDLEAYPSDAVWLCPECR